VIPVPVYAEKPAADYAWKLELIANNGDAVLTVFLPSEKNVRVLDFAPFVHSATPRAGSSGIKLSSSFLPIDQVSKFSFAINSEVSSLRNETCL
jgi:hypothetical protein